MQGQLENNTLICRPSYLDLDGLLSSYYSFPAQHNGHHVGVSLLSVQRLRGEQQPGVAEKEDLPGLVVGYQVLADCPLPLVLVQQTQVGDQRSWTGRMRGVIEKYLSEIRDQRSRIWTYLQHSPQLNTPKFLANHSICL